MAIDIFSRSHEPMAEDKHEPVVENSSSWLYNLFICGGRAIIVNNQILL